MQNLMALFRVICLLMLFFIFYTQGDISDKRLCADPNCSDVISHAKVMLRYLSSDHRMPSLKVGETVHVYSKSAGSRMDLWGIEVNGVRGYAPKDFLRESKVFIRTADLKYTLPTEKEERKAPAFVAGVSADSVPESTLSHDDITSPVEVIDGTTLFLNPDGDVAESKPIQATAVNANIQPTLTPQQTSIDADDTTRQTAKADTSETATSSGDVLKQGSNVIEKPNKPSSSESEGFTESINNFASGLIEKNHGSEAKAEQGEDELGEGSGDEDEDEEEEGEEEEEEEEEEDGEEDEEYGNGTSEDEEFSNVLDNSETNPSQIQSLINSNDGETEPLSDKAPLDVKNPPESVNDTEISMSQIIPSSVESGGGDTDPTPDKGPSDKEDLLEKDPDGGEKMIKSDKVPLDAKDHLEAGSAINDTDIATDEAASLSNETVVNEAKGTILNERADNSDFLSAVPQSGTELKSKVPVSEGKSLPLFFQRLPDVTETSDGTDPNQTVAEIKEIHNKSSTDDVGSVDLNHKEDIFDNSFKYPETDKETEQTEEKISVSSPHFGVQQTAENVKTTEVSNLDENISPESMPVGEQAAIVDAGYDKSLNQELQSVKDDESSDTNLKQVGEMREHHLKEPSKELNENLVDGEAKDISEKSENQANTTQIEEEQLPNETENTDFNKKEIEGQLKHEDIANGSPVDIHSKDTGKPVELMREEPAEITRKLESSEDSESVEVELEKAEFCESASLDSENLESNIGQGKDQQAKEQHKDHASMFLYQGVTTESGADGSYSDAPYANYTFTEAYTDVQETVTEIPSVVEEATDIPANVENDGQTNVASDTSSKFSDEDQQSISSEQAWNLVSNVTSLLFAGCKSLLEMIFGPSITVQVADNGAGEKTSLEKSVDGHIGHKERDQFASTYDKESPPVCDSECEARKLGSDPVVDHTLPSTKQKSPQYEYIMEDQKDSMYTKFFLSVTAVTVLLFTLGYYYIEKKQRDGTLLAKINRLEKALLTSAKEKSNLQVDLEETKEKLTSISNSSCPGDIISSLEAELEEAKTARIELEEQVASLEKELDTATETGLELNRMLSEFLSAQHGSDSLMKSVEHLQKQLDNQQGTINSMNSSLSAKSLENESLQADLNLAEERIKALEEEIQKMSQALLNVEKEKQEMEHEFQQKNKSIETQLVEALEGKSAESQRLGRELEALQEVLDETRRTLASRDGELEVLRDCLRNADVGGGGDITNSKLEELADVGRARAELALISREKDSLQERLQGEEEARKLLEDHVRIVSEEVDSLRVKYREAEHAKVEAQTRLEVLSTYFKEKETQLQKELGLQEAMYIQKEGDAMSTIERIKSLQEEVESYKSQNETLKKEILDQERGLKAQIATLERKVHENWVVARQAERKLEETKQENGQLRNRLTLVERNILNTSETPPKLNERHPIESNGEHPTSPLPLGLADLQDLPGSPLHYGHPASPPLLPPPGQPMPPPPVPFPPGLFMPPPPHGLPFMPPLPPGDRRPPPLGRMSSPPPSPYDRTPPPSPPGRPYRSPPPRYDDSPDRYRHRTTPPRRTPPPPYPPYPGVWDDHHGPPRSGFRPLRRESPREPKGSTLSSGHSSESIDKSSRHSGRV
ncbi:transport and Golgi organization protein 1 [Anabrus simplex]|uniref:transport and Golgi organization protein 1 n=1 Tax=Anabrus simplex TaxID=316456 RepID=UPI0035A2FC00